MDPVAERLIDRMEKRLDKQDIVTADIKATQATILQRLDQAHLNGDAPALRRLAKASPALVQVADHAPQIIELANRTPEIVALVAQQEDGRTFRRELKRITRWDKGTRGVFILALTVILAGVGSALGANFAHSNDNHASVPPAVPPVSAPPVRTSPTPIPTPGVMP